MEECSAILWGLVAVMFLLYYYSTWNYTFWKIRGVPGPKPIPLFGNVARVIMRSASIGQLANELYDTYKNEPIIGLYTMRTPTLLLKDTESIKNVLIRDFATFNDRGFKVKAKRWKVMRAKLSSTFTTRKLKGTFLAILKRSEVLEAYLSKIVDTEERIDIRDITDRFGIDVIGDCAYGVEAKALEHEDSEFREMAHHVFDASSKFQFRFTIQKVMPTVGNLFDYMFPDERVENFFYDLFWKTTEYRKKHNIVKHDFINTLMEIREQALKEDIGFSEKTIAAQTFVFFVAGLETTSITTCNTLYELAIHQDVQDKLRQEIEENYGKDEKDASYEEIRKMKYLDHVCSETLRKYPILQLLHRHSASDYTFENLNVTVPAGVNVWISIYGIHHDPNIYPNPEKFDPDRFRAEEVEKRHPMHYLPFGDGPRNCIGQKFAMYQLKISLIKLVRSFKFEVCKDTEIPYKVNQQHFMLTPKNKIYLKITKI